MKKFTILNCLLALLIACTNVSAQKITVTMAGNSFSGFNGDGNAGVATKLSAPYDVCVDAANNIYFTDYGNGRVRKIWASNGMVTTVAGGGSSTADGIPALQALITPRYMCIDATGNIYFVDFTTNKIRKIDAVSNIITTVAGTGTAGFSGDGGPAILATFNGMMGICVDNSNNIYVADSGNYRVREIVAGTGIIQTIAGSSTMGFSGDGGPATMAALKTPSAICVDASHNVYFCDQAAGYVTRVRAINAITGYITTIAGSASGLDIFNVPLLSTTLGDVTGLCMDPLGNFYCNEISCSCRKLDTHTDSTYEIAGNYGIESFSDCLSSPLSYMNNPYGICMDASGNIYTADTYNDRIRKIIQVTATPAFAYGSGQLVNNCFGATTDISQQMSITNMNLGETETWTVLTAPSNGSLTGFPYTLASKGTDSLTTPVGLSYTPTSGFSGTDMFKVRVSNGTLSDIVTIYVVSGTPGGTIATTPPVCIGMTTPLTESVPGGVWSLTNSNATISPVTGKLTGVVAGLDTAIYTINNMCGVAPVASGDVTIADCPLGVVPVSTVESLTIYPNPATSVLNIKWTNQKNMDVIAVTDITGRELLRNQLSSVNGNGSAAVDISTLVPGMYLVNVNNGTIVKKFVKE